MRPKLTVWTISLYTVGCDAVRSTKLKKVRADDVRGQRNPYRRIRLCSVDVNKVRLTALVAATRLCRDRIALRPVPLAAF